MDKLCRPKVDWKDLMLTGTRKEGMHTDDEYRRPKTDNKPKKRPPKKHKTEIKKKPP